MAASLKKKFIILVTLSIVVYGFLSTPTFNGTTHFIRSPSPKLKIPRTTIYVTPPNVNAGLLGENTSHINAVAGADRIWEGNLNNTGVATKMQDVDVMPLFLGLPNSTFRSPYHRYWETNCSLVFKQDWSVINATTELIERSRDDSKDPILPGDEQFSRYTQNCSTFRRNRKYPAIPLEREGEEFPLAYIILTHKDVAQVERLLRAIYQPQNIYCVHPDSKSPPAFQEAIRGLVSCFDNVFIPSKVERVQYAGFSRLQADINCMTDMLQKRVQWKYLVNLCAQDFPLKTNLETVRQLKAGFDHNFIGARVPTPSKHRRTKYRWVTTKESRLHRMEEEKTPPPYNFTIYSGSAYNAFTRAFVDFVIHDIRAIALLKWSEDTLTPDEHYWATLHAYPGVPGGYPNVLEMSRDFTFVKWIDTDDTVIRPACIGKAVRGICVFGMGYLKYLLAQPRVLANKFHYGFDPVAIQCMEEMLDYRQRFPESIREFVHEFPITKKVWKGDYWRQ